MRKWIVSPFPRRLLPPRFVPLRLFLLVEVSKGSIKVADKQVFLFLIQSIFNLEKSYASLTFLSTFFFSFPFPLPFPFSLSLFLHLFNFHFHFPPCFKRKTLLKSLERFNSYIQFYWFLRQRERENTFFPFSEEEEALRRMRSL